MSTSSSTANNTFSSKNQIPPATCARTLEAKGENISAQSLLANPHSPFSLVHKKTRSILYRKRNLMLRISGGLILIAIGVLFTEKLEVKTSKSDFFSFLGGIKKEVVQSVDLIVGGDIMLSRGIGRWAKQEGYDRTFRGENFHPLKQFSCWERNDCLLFFNLESPFSMQDNDQPKGGFLFRSNIANLQTLLDLKGKNQLLLSLANNHTSNAGGVGIELTREMLSGAEIGFLGAGTTKEQARAIWKQDKNGIALCFGAYSYDGTFNRFGGQWLAWNPLIKADIIQDLGKMQDIGCEVRILSLHRGAEYRIMPNKTQSQLAHELIDAGADIILGGHSHIPGYYEKYNGKPIVYSFGNMLFDQDRGKKASGRGFDYIYDYQLQRKTVPTYIPLLAQFRVIKTSTGIMVDEPVFKMARIDKGIYSPLDGQTFEEIMSKIRDEKQKNLPSNVEK